MEHATDRPRDRLTIFLAGLHAGMSGAYFLLAWLGLTAVLFHRSFWTPERLMATLFYGDRALRGSTWVVLTGAAVYLLVYSLAGGLFALAVGDRLPRLRLTLVSVLFALSWYYFSYYVIWHSIAPLVTGFHLERATITGHLIYGLLLSRYGAAPARKPPAQPETAPTAPPDESGATADPESKP